MLSAYDAETLDLHRQNVAEKSSALNTAVTGRDDFVRALLSKGAKPTEIARVAGISRERVYQIKQH